MDKVRFYSDPWHVDGDDIEQEYDILDAQGNLIAEVMDVAAGEEAKDEEGPTVTERNAFLLAAAPTLKEGIEMAIRLIREDAPNDIVVKFLKGTLQSAEPVELPHEPGRTHAGEVGGTDGQQRGSDGQREDPSSSRPS